MRPIVTLPAWEYLPAEVIDYRLGTQTDKRHVSYSRFETSSAMSVAWTPGVLNHRSKLAYDLGIVMTLETDNI